jgi:hypothetical protein
MFNVDKISSIGYKSVKKSNRPEKMAPHKARGKEKYTLKSSIPSPTGNKENKGYIRKDTKKQY